LEIELFVPATTANLGSGFDILGAALNFGNTFKARKSEKNTLVFSGKYAHELGEEGREYFFQKLEEAARILNLPPISLDVRMDVGVPPKRGLGSSATVALAVVEFLLCFHGVDLDPSRKLEVAISLEGHPDNVVPAMVGGVVFTFQEKDIFFYEKLPFPEEWKFAFFVSDFTISTSMARKILPESYERDTVIAQMRRISSLILAFHRKDTRLLEKGTEDFLHQDYRLGLSEKLREIFESVKALSPLAVFLSGSGPTIGAIFERWRDVGEVEGTYRLESLPGEGLKRRELC